MTNLGLLGDMTDIEDVTTDDPSERNVQADVNAFNRSLLPDTPVIRPPEDGHLTLQWGYEHDGELHKAAVVRELNGSDEEAMSKLKGTGVYYYAHLEEMIVRRATESIGDFTPSTQPGMTSSLLLGDRGLLFAHILLATYGPTKEYEEVKCPHCEALNDVEIDWFDLLDIRGMKGDSPTTIVKTKTRNIELRFPTGQDQIAVVSDNRDATDAEMNTTMIARVLVNDDIADKKRFVLRLSIPDRRRIVKALETQAPTVGFKECEVPCPSCDQKITFAFSWADLLFS